MNTLRSLGIGACLFFLPSLLVGQLGDTSRVAIVDEGDYYLLENGFLGVHIPKAHLFDPQNGLAAPAPIRAVLYPDGTWSNNSVNYLQAPTLPLSMEVEILENSPEQGRIRIAYTFDKPPYYSPSNQVLEEAGPGHYEVEVTMPKGEKACLVTESSDYEVGYSLVVSQGLHPDRGRYQGHRSTSLENGYDPLGHVYDNQGKEGWHATVNLQFQERKDFDPLARWNPWVENSGWHWQLYREDAPSEGKVFGIFDGRPSLLLGAPQSGTHLFTEPGAIQDLHSSCDAQGNCHLVWTSEGELWYKPLPADGSDQPEQLVGTGLIHPFVFHRGDRVLILGVNPADGSKVQVFRKTPSGGFQHFQVDPGMTSFTPYPYGAGNEDHDFLLLYGERQGQEGLHLFAAPAGDSSFVHSDVLEHGSDGGQMRRPDMKSTPDGRIVVAYNADVFFIAYAVVHPGQTVFDSTVSHQALPQQTAHGVAVDPRTGSFFFVDNNGRVSLVELDGASLAGQYPTPLGVPVSHVNTPEPNRRTLALDEAGNALAYHQGMFLYFDRANVQWSAFAGQGWDGIQPVAVFFNPQDGDFHLLGRFEGRLARFRFVRGSAPVLETTFPSTEMPVAGVQVAHRRALIGNKYYPEIRFEWGIFVGNKGEDLPPPDTFQAIGRTMNRLSGLGNKLDDYFQRPTQLVPDFEKGSVYIPSEAVQQLIQRVRTDEDFYRFLLRVDPPFKDVLEAWRDPDGALVQQRFQELVDYAEDVRDALTNRDGIYSFLYHYWMGGILMKRWSLWMSALMADGRLNESQKSLLVQYVGMFARIFWDDDFTPFFEEHGLNLGNPGMVEQYINYRWFFALLLAEDPEFQARAAEIPSVVESIIEARINEAGAPLASPHYLQPPNENLAFTLLQMKNAGIADFFAQNDRVRNLADFVLHLLTPESVRFANNRKLICFGDGSEETTALFGLLGTGYADVDPELSKHLLYAYRHGPARSSDFGIVTLAVNHDLPDAPPPTLDDGHFPGYLSTLRNAWERPEESALWFINGDFYFDHRKDDRGSVAAYALGVPLTLNFGSLYAPLARGGQMNNIVVPIENFPTWNQAQQSIDVVFGESWDASQHLSYVSLPHAGHSRARYTRSGSSWERRVHLFTPRRDLPVFWYVDSLSGGGEFVWSMNFMSDAPVNTPGGVVDPPERKYDWKNGPYEFPAASPEMPLAPGVQRFDFEGTFWSSHPSGGLDWELYLYPEETQSFTLSEWAHIFSPTVETDDYYATFGEEFEERQQLLRIKGQKGFRALVVPYWKGQRPPGLTVEPLGQGWRLQGVDWTFEFDETAYRYRGPEQTLLGTFTPARQAFEDMVIEGGAAEVAVHGDSVVVSVHGPSGLRQVELPPGEWQLLNPDDRIVYDSLTRQVQIDYLQTDSVHNSFRGWGATYYFAQNIAVSTQEPIAGRGQLHPRLVPLSHPVLWFRLPEGKPVTLRLYDATGRHLGRLFQGRAAQETIQRLELPAGLAPGVYFISIQTPEGVRTEKIAVISG